MQKVVIWLFRVIAAIVLLQTLYFKFTAHPQSVQLFTALEMEPWGRIATGIAELVTAILLLIPRTTLVGAIMGVCLMSGAIFFHITKLRIHYGGDIILFSYAVITFICCVILIFINRKRLPDLLKFKILG